MLENMFATIGLAVFLVAAYLVGRVLNRWKHRRFTKAWEPIRPVIGGTVHEDPGGGGACSWLVGRWKDRAIHARMAPGVRYGTSSSAPLENRFAVVVADVDGSQDWSITRTFLGPAPLRIESADAALGERLVREGALRVVEEGGRPTVRFNKNERALHVEEDVRPAWVPNEARFRLLLDIAVDLARLHDAVEGGTRRSA